MNERGQEFSGFRLLVDVVLVLLILVIIIGILGWVESLRFQISERRVYEGFDKAVNSPDGTTVVEKNITLRSGLTYVSGTFAARAHGISRECIRFDALGLTAFQWDSTQIDVRENVQVDVFYRCIKNFGGWKCMEECELCCEISFGKEFAQEWE